MRKFRFLSILMLGAFAASLANAVTVTFNGTAYTLEAIALSQAGDGLTIVAQPLGGDTGGGDTGGGDTGGGDTGGGDTGGGDTGGGDTGGGDTGGGDTGGGDTGGTGACVESTNQECGGLINWASPGSRVREGVTGTNEVISWQFTTTSNRNYSGDINISETTGNELVSRSMWISRSPGGDALPASRCSTEGVSGRKISWAQTANFLRCSLDTNTTYFLNVKNVRNCSSGRLCEFYRNIGTSGNP